MTDVNRLIVKHLDVWTSAVEKKSSAGRGNGGGVSLYGVKKLRELILELAVRGKLVPQLQNEGSGENLKDEVLRSRAAAIRAKRMRKQKELPEISDDEIPFQVPTSWALIRLGELTNYGVTDKAEARDMDDGVWVLELEDVEKVSSRLLQRVYFSDRRFKSSKNRFLVGDVIYGKLRPYLDKVLIADEDGVCTTEMIPMRAFGEVSSDFLRLFLKSPEFIRYADDSTHGMNLPRLGTEKARMAVVPMPPLAEQHRIVAKVDELMELCDALELQAEDSLKAHQTLVETCLATLTNSQSPEELTQNWTRIEAHFDTLFTTEESVEALRGCVWSLAVRGLLGSYAAASSSDGSNPTKDAVPSIAARKNRKPVPLLSEEDVPFGIPDGWVWHRVCELFQVSSGTSFPAKDELDRGEYAYIKVADMNLPENQTEIQTSSRFIDPDIKQKKKLIPANSIVFPKRGGAIATNKKRLVRSEIFADLNIMALTVPTAISIDYVMIWLKGIDLARLNTGTSVPQINHQDIDPLPFPLPPRCEQDFIVAKVRALEELCDFLKQRLSFQNQLSTDLADALTSKIH